MKNLVHYLVRHPEELSGYIYPTESVYQNYTSFGAFYLVGVSSDAELADGYIFHAVYGDEVIPVMLERVRGTLAIFQVAIRDVGTFQFRANKIRNPGKYLGAEMGLKDLSAIRQLKPRAPTALDSAAREHNFYFIGHSPRVPR